MFKRYLVDYTIKGVEDGIIPVLAPNKHMAFVLALRFLECYTSVRPFEILHIAEEK